MPGCIWALIKTDDAAFKLQVVESDKADMDVESFAEGILGACRSAECKHVRQAPACLLLLLLLAALQQPLQQH